MTKNHAVGYYSDKDRRKVRRSYKATKDFRGRKKDKKNEIPEDFQDQNEDEDTEY